MLDYQRLELTAFRRNKQTKLYNIRSIGKHSEVIRTQIRAKPYATWISERKCPNENEAQAETNETTRKFRPNFVKSHAVRLLVNSFSFDQSEGSTVKFMVIWLTWRVTTVDFIHKITTLLHAVVTGNFEINYRKRLLLSSSRSCESMKYQMDIDTDQTQLNFR